MNRRRFLSLLSQATVGATVAYSFPSIIVPKNIQPAYALAPHGLACLINDNSRVLQGIDTVTFCPGTMPEQFFTYAQTFLNQMFYKASLVVDYEHYRLREMGGAQ